VEWLTPKPTKTYGNSQRTAELSWLTPMIDPVMYVSYLQNFKCSVKYKVNAQLSAATPSNEVTFVILDPIVLTIFQPHVFRPQ
jgi:hypothetical protein